MKTCKFAVLFSILLLFSFTVSAQTFQSERTAINAVLEDITPFPVEPGQDFTVKMRIENNGGDEAEDVEISLLENDAFYLTGQGDNFNQPFDLCGSCSRDNLYYFTASPDAVSGEYPLIFKIRHGNAEKEKTVTVRLIGDPDLTVELQPKDDSIAPGDAFQARLKLRNDGTGSAKNIKLTPATTGFVFQPSNTVFIPEIKPNSSLSRQVTLTSSADLDTGLHTLEYNLSYKDEVSTTFSQTLSSGVELANSVELGLSTLSFNPSTLLEDNKGSLTVRVENLGEGDARNVRVRLRNDALQGTKTAYIGKLEEDEDAPAVFSIIPSADGSMPTTLEISYSDDTGTHTVTEETEVYVQKNGQFRTVLILLLALAVLGYFLHTKFRDNKQV